MNISSVGSMKILAELRTQPDPNNAIGKVTRADIEAVITICAAYGQHESAIMDAIPQMQTGACGVRFTSGEQMKDELIRRTLLGHASAFETWAGTKGISAEQLGKLTGPRTDEWHKLHETFMEHVYDLTNCPPVARGKRKLKKVA